MIVLDTNVLSEILLPRPAPSVAAWLAAQSPASIFTTTITEAEVRYGIRLLPEGRRRRDLEAAIEPIFGTELAGRILPFDSAAAHAYAGLTVLRRRAGRSIGPFDAQIAGIALSRGCALATRNIADFEGTGLALVDPWSA